MSADGFKLYQLIKKVIVYIVPLSHEYAIIEHTYTPYTVEVQASVNILHEQEFPLMNSATLLHWHSLLLLCVFFEK